MTQKPINPSLVSRIAQAAQYVISGVTPETWFGPLQPLEPMAPADVAGRRFDYPTGYNLNYNPRAHEPVAFSDLRALADNCDILRSVIETRKDQIEALEWTIRVKPSMMQGRVAMPDQQARIAYISEFVQSPDRENGFAGWLRQILEDMFVIDAAAIYKRRARDGSLWALEIVDGATIKPLIDDTGRAPLAPDPAYQQVLKGVPAVDYTREELLYLKHNPRSHKVYGYSHVEQVIVTVNILIRRALHQLEYYRDGSQPDAFIGLPKEWNQDQIVAFQKHFDAMLAGNLAMRRRLRFMPGEFKYQETKQPPLKDAYDEFLARIICYVFSVSPEPFVSHVNRATAESSQARASDEGLVPLQRYVTEFMNRIIRADFASPDLEFVWQDTREQDPKDAAQIDVAYVQAGIMTVDEVRASLGLLPLPKQKTQTEPVKKFNPNHDERGRFATADGTGSGDGNRVLDPKSSGQPGKTDGSNDRVDSSNLLEDTALLVSGAGRAGPIVNNIRNIISSAQSDGEAAGNEMGNASPSADSQPNAEVTNNEENATSSGSNDWTLGSFKSAQRWANQMATRGWTSEDIDQTIATGDQFPAPNMVNPSNTATRYVNPITNKYLVRDDVTKEVLQLGGSNFNPPKMGSF